jgi:Kelch motif protein/K319-like protein
MNLFRIPVRTPAPCTWASVHVVIPILLLAATCQVSAADPFAWIARSACPLQRFEAAGGAATGKLYQFSGYYTTGKYIKATAECDSYDPATNIWQRIADIPQPISHCGQVADEDNPNDQIFWLAGGFLGDHPGPSTTQVWKYSINNNTWTPGPPLPDQRGGGALVKLGRELHYFGGVIRQNDVYLQDYGTHWAFNLDTDTAWRTTTTFGQILAPLPNPRNHMGGTVLNGKIYAVGGQHLGNQNTPQSEVDVYDPATNSWSQAAPMPRPIGHVTANVFVRNGRVVVTTGRMANGVLIPNVIEYNPASNTWSELPPVPGPRQSPISGLIGDQMVVTCGSDSRLKAQTWVTTPTGVLPAPWLDKDIGSMGMSGNASTTDYSSSFSVGGSGVGAAGNADNFNYLYQPLKGDGQIIVRVATQDNTGSSAQAGIMVRETLDPTSKHAAMLITPSNGILFGRRLSTGGATSQTVFSGVAAPYWLKLVRAGNTFTGYRRADGGTWTRLGSNTVITMTGTVYVGLAVASSSNVAVSQAGFDNLNLGPKANAGADQTIVLPSTATLSRTATDDGLPAGTLGYTWRKINGPGNVTFAGTSTSDTVATFSAAGVYTLRLTANDSQLLSTDDMTITVNPSP